MKFIPVSLWIMVAALVWMFADILVDLLLTVIFLTWQGPPHGVWRRNQQQDFLTPYQSSQFVSFYMCSHLACTRTRSYTTYLLNLYELLARLHIAARDCIRHTADAFWGICQQVLLSAIICNHPHLCILQAFKFDIPVSNAQHTLCVSCK